MMKNQRCRICLNEKQEDQLIYLFEPHESSKTIASLIEYLVDIEISQFDNFPQFTCDVCLSKLEDAYDIIKQCEKNDRKLKKELCCEVEANANEKKLYIEVESENENASKEHQEEENVHVELLYEDDQEPEAEYIEVDPEEISREYNDQYSPAGALEIDFQENMETTSSKRSSKAKNFASPDNPKSQTTESNGSKILKLTQSVKNNHSPATPPQLKTVTSPKFQQEKFKKFSVTKFAQPIKKIIRTVEKDTHNDFVVNIKNEPMVIEDVYTVDSADNRNPHKEEKPVQNNSNDNSKSFICEYCQKEFKALFILRGHIKIVHARIPKQIECLTCFHQFVTEKAYITHLQVDNCKETRRVPCDSCQMLFSNKFNMLAHKKNVHLEIMEYPCDFCKLKFGTSSLLSRHLFLKHKMQQNSNRRLELIK